MPLLVCEELKIGRLHKNVKYKEVKHKEVNHNDVNTPASATTTSSTKTPTTPSTHRGCPRAAGPLDTTTPTAAWEIRRAQARRRA